MEDMKRNIDDKILSEDDLMKVNGGLDRIEIRPIERKIPTVRDIQKSVSIPLICEKFQEKQEPVMEEGIFHLPEPDDIQKDIHLLESRRFE